VEIKHPKLLKLCLHVKRDTDIFRILKIIQIFGNCKKLSMRLGNMCSPSVTCHVTSHDRSQRQNANNFGWKPEELSPVLYINLSVAKNFPFYVQDIRKVRSCKTCISTLLTINTLLLLKRIKTLLATSLTTLFLGLSSLFPYQAFSTTDSESLPFCPLMAIRR
jgi:hypothetical protein